MSLIGKTGIMLHLVYILAFTIIALLAVSNLIRSLISLSAETQKFNPANYNNRSGITNKNQMRPNQVHPELLDEEGQVIEEPLLVMRSVSVDDARSKLDALYKASPGKKVEPED